MMSQTSNEPQATATNNYCGPFVWFSVISWAKLMPSQRWRIC